VAEDTGGLRDAGPWIAKAHPEYTVLIDQQQIVTKLYSMVNVPTAVWIDERGKIVRPNEVAFVDNRFEAISHVDAGPYLAAIRDWIEKGDNSTYVLSDQELRQRLTPPSPDRLMADAEFTLGEYLYHTGHGADAIPHFKEAQHLAPDNWNYKRQAWALSSAERDYGTSFAKEVQKLNGKPYYAPRQMPALGKRQD
jgi:hypothetical protein